MGTPLTGSTVASTYTSLLKTADTTPFSSTLKTICDGAGNNSKLQVSTLGVKSDGTFESQGAATLSSTLAVTGATTLSSLFTNGNASVDGALNVTGATTLAGLTMTGNLSVPGTLSSTGNFAVNTNKFTVTSASGNTAVAGTLDSAGDFKVATNKFTVAAATGNTAVAGTLGVTGASNLSTLNVSGLSQLAELDALSDTTVGGTLVVTGATTLSSVTASGNATLNANTTLGDAGTDTLTINSDNVTLPNVSSATIDFANDTLLIRDNSASNKVRTATMAQITPQCVQTIYQSIQSYTAVNTGPGTEISVLTTSITPRSSGSKLLITIVLNYCMFQGHRGVFRLTRNGTEIGSNLEGASLYGIAPVYQATAGFDGITNTVIQFYDTSPAAGSNTYKINVFSAGAGSIFTVLELNRNLDDVGNGPNNFDRARTSSTMTIQEFLA